MPAYGDYAGRGVVGGSEYGPPSGPPPGAEYRGDDGAVVGEKKDHDKRNMMIAAAGGLAVGAVGAAVIAEAFGMFFTSSPFSFLFSFLPFCSHRPQQKKKYVLTHITF